MATLIAGDSGNPMFLKSFPLSFSLFIGLFFGIQTHSAVSGRSKLQRLVSEFRLCGLDDQVSQLLSIARYSSCSATNDSSVSTY